jgi:hypothetical protein
MLSIEILDFDSIDEWASKLTNVLCPLITGGVKERLTEAKPEYIEDARDLLFKLTDRNAVIDTVLAWLCSNKIMGYHGSRLTDTEMVSVQTNGLIPLKAHMRRDRLTRALSHHPRWNEVKDQLDGVIQANGQGDREGHREDQIHITLSMAGLTYGFNHYLIYGSEFDQHVAQKLLGADGMELLSFDGKPRVIKIAVPGDVALKAAHPFFSIDNVRAMGDVPNLVKEFLTLWSYKLSNPRFQSRQLKADCGMVFHQTIPADWIVDISTIDNNN